MAREAQHTVCPQCHATVRSGAKFCHRCGQPLETRGVWLLGVMSTSQRVLAHGALRRGTLKKPLPFVDPGVFLGEAIEAFFEAVKRVDAAASIRLIRGAGRKYDLVVEGAGLIARCCVSHPYARIELRGPRQGAQRTVERVVARCGGDVFGARNGNWKRFATRTGVDEAHNRATLSDLLGRGGPGQGVCNPDGGG